MLRAFEGERMTLPPFGTQVDVPAGSASDPQPFVATPWMPITDAHSPLPVLKLNATSVQRDSGSLYHAIILEARMGKKAGDQVVEVERTTATLIYYLSATEKTLVRFAERVELGPPPP